MNRRLKAVLLCIWVAANAALVGVAVSINNHPEPPRLHIVGSGGILITSTNSGTGL